MRIVVTVSQGDAQDYVLNGKISHKDIEFQSTEEARKFVRSKYEEVCKTFSETCGINEKSYYHDVRHGTCYAMVLSDKYIWDACIYLL